MSTQTGRSLKGGVADVRQGTSVSPSSNSTPIGVRRYTRASRYHQCSDGAGLPAR